MPIPQTMDFISEQPLVYLKYYLRGTDYSSEMSHYDHGEAKIESVLNNYYWQQKVIYESPCEIRSRLFKTHYFVYEVHQEQRDHENDLEFRELECTHKRKFKEIWRCFFRPEHIDKLDNNPPIEEVVNYVGNFFIFPYRNLEELIRNNIIQGWTRVEIIASIHKLLAIESEKLLSFEKENVENLRQMVARNPELIQQQVTTHR